MGTDLPPDASDPVSPPVEEPMPHEPAEDADPPPEVDAAIRHLLSTQPGPPIPAAVRDRIARALQDEAATRAALVGNDADPAPAASPLDKIVDPVRDRENLS